VVNDYGGGSAIALITVVLLLGVVAVYMRQMLKIGEVE
jgi:N,N'-diacetylchitobiose transport system permease protein